MPMYLALLLVFSTVTCCVCQHSIKALLTYLLKNMIDIATFHLQEIFFNSGTHNKVQYRKLMNKPTKSKKYMNICSFVS